MITHKPLRFFLSASSLLAATTLLLLLFFAHLQPASAQSRGRKSVEGAKTRTAAARKPKLQLTRPFVSQAVKVASSRPARELGVRDRGPADPGLLERGREINKLNSAFVRRPNPNARPQRDGALQSSWTARRGFTMEIPAPSLDFDGLTSFDNAVVFGFVVNPPDPSGAVGPDHFVQSTNLLVRVWNKDGTAATPFFPLSALFAEIGGICSTDDSGDTITLYDRLSDRWLISQFNFANVAAPPYHQCIAISKTGDPTGEYWAYDFITPGAEFNDYFKFGIWPDAYYMTDRQFTNGGPFNGFGVFAFDKAKMMVGDPTSSFIYFNTNDPDFGLTNEDGFLSNSSSGMLPTDFNGITPPPPGAPNLFAVYLDDAFDDEDALRLFDFHADFATPVNSTFTERPESPLAVAAFDSRDPRTPPSPFRNDIEQPAPATPADYLDSIGDRLMLRLQYINRNGTELVTTVHTVNGGVIPADPEADPTIAEYQAAVRYYVLQKTTPAGNWSVQDQGTFSPDTNERWMGSSALDNAGNLAVGYSVSSLTVRPSIWYSGRLATDPPGMLTDEQIMFTGPELQRSGGGNRWGDYTHMSVDPADDSTFWYVNQYQGDEPQLPSGFNWRTRIGRFKFAESTAPAQGTLSGTITNCSTGDPLADAIVTLTGGPSTGFSSTTGDDGAYSFNVAPGTYSVVVTDETRACDPAAPESVMITDGNTTPYNACLQGAPDFSFESFAVSGDDSALDANECNNLNVTILNDGCLASTGVTAVLSSTTPGVQIIQPDSAYPNQNIGASGTNSTPFTVSTLNTFVCGTTIDFTLTVSFPGGSNTLSFSVPTCAAPTAMFSGALAAGDTIQPGRLGRNSPAGCAGKPCPGIFTDTNPRRYDTFTFTNGPSATCATFTTTAACGGGGTQIITAAYLNSYNPNNLCQNYLGDGASATTFSTNIPANATVILVVSEASTATAGCASYSVAVDGLVGNSFGDGFCGAPDSVLSRKNHTGVDDFNINLPLAGTVGIESRATGGTSTDYQVVYTFPAAVTFDSADVTIGDGSVVSTSDGTTPSTEVTVNLTGVTNVQQIQVTLFGADNTMFEIPRIDVPMRILVGDVNFNAAVNGGDIIRTKSQSGQLPADSNFRLDSNASGQIDGNDTILVKSKTGTGFP